MAVHVLLSVDESQFLNGSHGKKIRFELRLLQEQQLRKGKINISNGDKSQKKISIIGSIKTIFFI